MLFNKFCLQTAVISNTAVKFNFIVPLEKIKTVQLALCCCNMYMLFRFFGLDF